MSLSAIVDAQPSDYRNFTPAAAYLSTALLRTGDVHLDDIIRIETERHHRVLARVVGELPGTAGEVIRFDRFTRQSLKAFPNERVTVEVIDAALPPAREVVLIPGIDLSTRRDPGLVAHLQKTLADARVPVAEGMLLYIPFPDSTAGITYDVHSVEDGHEGLFTAQTRVYLEVADHEHGTGGHNHQHSRPAQTGIDTTYQDIGGLTGQMRLVRELIELPLVFPQVYRQLGITPPHGVIFYGAPGTGKTLLARSISNEIHAHFYYINGPEIVGTYSGQTEENLRKLFGDASLNAPSIILIDEIDAIAPTRGSTSSLSDTRAVTQLLSLMDGLKTADSVMVIGSTNRIDALDPALRRAGRFDREIYFPTPSASAREEILRIHTREMPMSADALATLPEIARRAHGFVGADLMELAREAGLNALRRASEEFLLHPSATSYPASDDLVITPKDLNDALAQVHPASLRESLLSFPSVSYSDIGGLASVKRALGTLIQNPFRHPEAFARLGLNASLGVVLYGPPGTGKTLLAKAIAYETGVNFIAIQGPELFSQWLGESEETVRHIFDMARRAAPCLIFFDQLDAVAPRRNPAEREASAAPHRVVNQILAEMDGMEPLSRVVVIGATNRLDWVDPSVLRPGRFGVHLHVELPRPDERAQIFAIHLRGAAWAAGVQPAALIDRLLPVTDGFSGADIAFLCQAAKLKALEGQSGKAQPALAPDHFQDAMAEFGLVRDNLREGRRE